MFALICCPRRHIGSMPTHGDFGGTSSTARAFSDGYILNLLLLEPMLRACMLTPPILHERTRNVMTEPSTLITFFEIEIMTSVNIFLRLYVCSYHRHFMERTRRNSRVSECSELPGVIAKRSAKYHLTGS